MVTFAVLIVVTLVVIGVASSIAKHNREAEAARRVAEAERQREEETRLAPKRRALAVLKARADEERRLFDSRYTQIFVHEHYDEIMNDWPREFEQYREWKADQPDFQRLVHELNADEMLRLWNRKAEIREYAAGLDMAARESWKARRFEEFKEAERRGVTLDELPAVQEYEAKWVAERKMEFDRWIRDMLDPDPTHPEYKQAFAEAMGFPNWESFQEFGVRQAAVIATRSPAERAHHEIVARMSAALDQYAIARALGTATTSEGALVRELATLQHELPAAPDNNTLIDLWTTFERIAFECVLMKIDRAVELCEEQPIPRVFTVKPPYRRWAERYKERLGVPRTTAQIAELVASAGS